MGQKTNTPKITKEGKRKRYPCMVSLVFFVIIIESTFMNIIEALLE